MHTWVLGSAVFILANALLAPGLAVVPAAIVLTGCLASLAIMIRLCQTAPGTFFAELVQGQTLAACSVVALILCVLGGEGHLFYASDDWLIRDAVLGDLSGHGFPITYSHKGADFFLRAPLGMYMLPAVAGRGFGAGAAHTALLLQNTLLLALILYLFTQISRIGTTLFLALFIAFSGLDVLPSAVFSFAKTGTFWLPRHLEGAIPWFQYSSHVTQIFWVPNHGLPGWWFAALAILCARGQLGLPALVIMIAALSFWSPLSMIGAFVILLVLAVMHFRELIRAPLWWSACAAGAGLIPVLLYMLTDAGAVSGHWLIVQSGFPMACILFLAYEIPHFAVINRAWSMIGAELKPLLIASVIMLVVMPIYGMGPGNDFLTRGSIVPLSILAIVFCTLVPEIMRGANRELAYVTAGIIAIGAVTPLFEIGRAVLTPAFAISRCNVITAWSQTDPNRWISNYMASVERMPGWLLRAEPGQRPLKMETGPCWPDHSISPLPMDWHDPRNGVPAQ